MLFILSCIAWIVVLLLPFSNFSITQISGATTVLIVLAELLFWCSIVLLGKTVFYKKKDRFISFDDVPNINESKPVEPWAFVRVKNEIKTIDACLQSILPVIKKGVIGYNDCDDGSEEYILNFCKENPGYIPFKYPYTVYPPCHKLYFEGIKEDCRLDAYYNAVLSKIPKGEWLIKIDCDHVFDAEKLRKALYLPRRNNDCVIFSFLNLHYQNNELLISRKYPLLGGGDFWLVRNDKLRFIMKVNHKHQASVESLRLGRRKRIFTDCTNWHFPCVKGRDTSNYDFVPFNQFREVMTEEEISKVPADLLDEKRIIRECEKLNLK